MTDILSSSNIKRQILAESDITGIRKRVLEDLETKKGEVREKYVEMGNALEALTTTPGWVVVETYIMEYAMKTLLKDEMKELTKGMIHLVQWVDQMIRVKNDLKARGTDATD